MKIEITIPDAKASVVADAFAERFSWTEQDGLRRDFAKVQLQAFIRSVIRDYLVAKNIAAATATARDQGVTEADAVTITVT